MMIADLIDQDDLYQHFTNLGVPLDTPESADRVLKLWFRNTKSQIDTKLS